ncbi:hypothetical protein ACFSCV_01740 [Methylopila henanensis]|uniref:DUF3703 domain-containing protein n=1 Tax=Methylopila henanensis TaxID=873516 RepID=A0ABW4K2J9_9HYPH
MPPLGDPPDCLIDPDAREAWHEFEAAAPWLNRSHRAVVHIACHLHARMRRGEAGVPALNLLRQCLNSLGLTPTSTAAIRALPESADPADPATEFFN